MKTFLTIPTVSNYHINPHPNLLRWAIGNNLKPHFIDNFMPPWRARMEIVFQFLNSNADDLLMIDYDTVPTFNYSYLLSLQRPNRIVAGHYALFTNYTMFQWSIGKRDRTLADRYQFTPEIPEGISFWDVCGFGCVLMPRQLVVKAEAAGCFKYIPTPEKTEDTKVCDWLIDHGAEIVTSHLLMCEHWRTIDLSKQLITQSVLADRIRNG